MPAPNLTLVDSGLPGQSSIQFNELFNESNETGIVAGAGGTQAKAYQLTAQTSRVSTVATANDSIQLPPAKPGLELLIINHGVNAMQVFGNGADTIDDQTNTVGVSQMPNSAVIYFSAEVGKWYSEGLATGFGGPGLQTVSTQDGLTARAGGGQQLASVAPVINKMINRVTTVTSGNDSATLPASAAGMQIIIINAAAANSMNVFPLLGDQINALGANAAFALAANKTATFYCSAAGQWHAVLTA